MSARHVRSPHPLKLVMFCAVLFCSMSLANFILVRIGSIQPLGWCDTVISKRFVHKMVFNTLEASTVLFFKHFTLRCGGKHCHFNVVLILGRGFEYHSGNDSPSEMMSLLRIFAGSANPNEQWGSTLHWTGIAFSLPLPNHQFFLNHIKIITLKHSSWLFDAIASAVRGSKKVED
jgi:hypothetical protein